MTRQCVVGVDLGGTMLRTALADTQGTILKEIRLPTQAFKGSDHVLELLGRTVRDAGAGAGEPVEILALGIGVPGPVDAGRGFVYLTPNLPWRDLPLGDIMEKSLNIPVAVDNDANLAALGEFEYGAGRGTAHMVYVTVSTGVGAGLILQGRLYHGGGYGAGELGHMVIDPAGPECGCGNRGCLEALASGTAMAREARRLVASGKGAGILALAGGRADDITARVLGLAADGGDAEALDIIRRAGKALGIGLANVINLLNPQVIVLGGGAMGLGKPLWDAMLPEAQGRSLGNFWQQVKITEALLQGSQGLMGAVALALKTGGK